MLSLAALLMALSIMASSVPAGAAELKGSAGPAVTPGPSELVARPSIDGLDFLKVSVKSGIHVEGGPGAASVCISGQRTELTTEDRGGTQVQIKEEHSLYGCADTTAFRFDPSEWVASATAAVPTEVMIWVYELGPDGWKPAGSRPGPSGAHGTIDLAWTGVGDERMTPRVSANPFCFVLPPVCVSARMHFDRDATVQGILSVPELGIGPTSLTDVTGSMQWSQGW